MKQSDGRGGDLRRGVAAGLVATFCMSVIMLAARKLVPTPKLPPRKIVETAMEVARVPADHSTTKAAAGLAHFGFGAAAGALFALVRERIAGGPVAQGVGFGLLVWAVSYKGWIPALGIMPPPERDNPKRAATMFAAHAVYGAVLGGCMGDTRRAHRWYRRGQSVQLVAQG